MKSLVDSIVEGSFVRSVLLLEEAKLTVDKFIKGLEDYSDVIINNKKDKQVYTVIQKRDITGFKNFVKKSKWKIADYDESTINCLYWLE